jgi:hypothetical protein
MSGALFARTFSMSNSASMRRTTSIAVGEGTIVLFTRGLPPGILFKIGYREKCTSGMNPEPCLTIGSGFRSGRGVGQYEHCFNVSENWMN